MSLSASEVRRYMMALPLEERTEIAYEVLDSMADDDFVEDAGEVQSAWPEEIVVRADEIRNGTAETYALEDVPAEMEERYG